MELVLSCCPALCGTCLTPSSPRLSLRGAAHPPSRNPAVSHPGPERSEPKQEQIHSGLVQRKGPGSPRPHSLGDGLSGAGRARGIADSDLSRNCGLRPAGLAVPSGRPVDIGRLNMGFLVLLTLPLPSGASVSQRQRPLQASGQGNTQDVPQSNASDGAPASCCAPGVAGRGVRWSPRRAAGSPVESSKG